jgi:hypothetical protein
MSYADAIKRTKPQIMNLITALPQDVQTYIGSFLIRRSSYADAIQEVLDDASKFLMADNFCTCRAFAQIVTRILCNRNKDVVGYTISPDDMYYLKHDIWARIFEKSNIKSVWNLVNLTATIYVRICTPERLRKYTTTTVPVHTGPFSGERFGYIPSTLEDSYRKYIKQQLPSHPHVKIKPWCQLVHPGITEIVVNESCTIIQDDMINQYGPGYYYPTRPTSIGSYAIAEALDSILLEIQS